MPTAPEPTELAEPAMAEAAPTPRRSRDELKSLVVDAAYDLLETRGVRLEPSSITYQRVFEHLERTAGVTTTRGSVHERIWPSQAAFQRDCLGRAIETQGRADEGATDRVVAEVLARVDLSTLAGRQHALRELTRYGVAAEEQQSWASLEARFVACVAAVVSTLPADERAHYDDLVDLARENQLARFERNVETFAGLSDLLGTTIRPDLGIDHDAGVRLTARVVTMFFEGSLARNSYGAEPATIDIRLDDGTTEPWSLTAWGAYRIVRWASVFRD